MSNYTIEAPPCNADPCTGASVPDESVLLSDILKLIEGKTCRFDGTALPQHIDMYEHDGGWNVAGFPHRMWLSTKCPKCRYEWSLWKLGVAR